MVKANCLLNMNCEFNIRACLVRSATLDFDILYVSFFRRNHWNDDPCPAGQWRRSWRGPQ